MEADSTLTSTRTTEQKGYRESNQRQHATRRVLKSEVKTGDGSNRSEQANEKHCTFHERKGHELSECKASKHTPHATGHPTRDIWLAHSSSVRQASSRPPDVIRERVLR